MANKTPGPHENNGTCPATGISSFSFRGRLRPNNFLTNSVTARLSGRVHNATQIGKFKLDLAPPPPLVVFTAHIPRDTAA